MGSRFAADTLIVKRASARTNNFKLFMVYNLD
jgi:hypothetical protein